MKEQNNPAATNYITSVNNVTTYTYGSHTSNTGYNQSKSM